MKINDSTLIQLVEWFAKQIIKYKNEVGQTELYKICFEFYKKEATKLIEHVNFDYSKFSDAQVMLFVDLILDHYNLMNQQNKNNLKSIIKECISEILKESYLSLDEVTHPELADTRMDFVKGKQSRELIDPPQKAKTKKEIRYKIGNNAIVIPANHDILLFHSKNPQLNSYVFAGEKVWCPVSKENQTEFLHEKSPCWKGYKQYGTKDKGGKEVPNCVPVKEENTRLPIIKKRFS